jgi:hypothetical protein
MEFPEQFDWVQECLKCSLEGAFQTLHEVIDNDVKTMNRERPEIKIHLESMVGGKFAVRKGDAPIAAVFELDFETRSINVRHGNKTIFAAKPEMCPDGECRLKVNSEYLRFWQVSKKALEELWFKN